jgi:hypothetical protein
VKALGNAAISSGNSAKTAMHYYGLWGFVLKNWHNVLALGIDFLAVSIPATIALFAGLIGMAPELLVIASHMKAVITAGGTLNDTLTKGVKPLNDSVNSFHQLALSLKPDAIELFGSAINLAGGQVGTFSKLATGASQVIDTFMAKLDLDVTGQNGLNFSGRLGTEGVRDMTLFGQALGNVAHVITNLAAAAPGTAEILLGIVAAASKFLAALSNLPKPILTIGLAFESIRRYSGLAAAGLNKILPAVLGFFSKVGLGAGVLAERLGAKGLASGLTDFAAGAEKLAGIPVAGWAIGVTIAVGIGLVLALDHAKTSTDKLLSSVNRLTQTSSNVAAITTITSNIGKLRTAEDQVTQSTKHASTAIGANRFYLEQQATASHQVSGALQGQYKALGNVLQGAEALSRMYHVSFPVALAIADKANIKLVQGFTGTGEAAQVARQKVLNYMTGLEQMIVPIGRLGGDIDALEAAQNEQASSLNKVNQAWNTFIQNATAAQGNFADFADAVHALNHQVAATGTSITGAVGSLKTGSGSMAKSLNSLSQAGLQTRQQFYSLVNGPLESLVENLRSAKLPTDQFRNAIRDAVQQILPFAKGNKAALGVLKDFADQTLGTNGNLKELMKGELSNKAAMKQLSDITNTATGKMSDLQKQAQSLNDTLQQDVTNAMSKAKFATSGASGQINLFTKALQHSSQMTPQLRSEGHQLYETLRSLGISAHQAHVDVDGLISSYGRFNNLPNIHKQVTVDELFNEHGNGVPPSELFPGPGPAGGGGGGGRGGHPPIGGPNHATVISNIHIDGRQIFQVVQKHALRRQKRSGNNGLQKLTR